LRRAVFLDRDGVINRERSDYVRSWSEFEFLPQALPALAALNWAGATVVVVTNQSVVGRGLISEQQLARIHDRMRSEISAAGGDIDAVYVCIHTPAAGCPCRKPRTALFESAAADLGIDLRESVMVGDALTDVQAARAVGCRPVLVGDSRPGLPNDVMVVEDLAQAVERIIRLPVGAVNLC
jgi:D-glycero-D-manno-heptose 1,7-bisphosphate phosphatase